MGSSCRRSSFKLGTKAVICAVVLIALNTALVVGAAYWSLTSEFNARALRDIEVNLRTLAMTFSESYGDAKIAMKDGAVGRAEIAKMPEFKDHAIVDRSVSYVGGVATLFVYDDATNQFVRRSTNLKKENGDRAVGTQLAPDHPGQAVVRRGEAYKGPAVLFGKNFMTAYYPDCEFIRKGHRPSLRRDSDGAVRGACWRRRSRPWPSRPALPRCWCMVLTMLIVRRVTKPLTSVTASLTAIADGNSDVEIDCHERTTRSARSPAPSPCSRTTRTERQPHARRAGCGRRCRRRAAQG